MFSPHCRMRLNRIKNELWALAWAVQERVILKSIREQPHFPDRINKSREYV